MGNVISQTASILVWALESPIFRKSPVLHLAFPSVFYAVIILLAAASQGHLQQSVLKWQV